MDLLLRVSRAGQAGFRSSKRRGFRRVLIRKAAALEVMEKEEEKDVDENENEDDVDLSH